MLLCYFYICFPLITFCLLPASHSFTFCNRITAVKSPSFPCEGCYTRVSKLFSEKQIEGGNGRDGEVGNDGIDSSDVLKQVRLAEEERLQKVIARAGIASRRAAEKMILDGRITVNGKIITELGYKVKPRKDLIVADGVKIQLPDSTGIFWIILHKPRGVLTTLSDEKERATIASLVPKAKELRLLPVGRLERDATGLMILTNENGWIHPLTHHSFSHKKKYEVTVQGFPTEEQIESLKKGALLPGESVPLKPCTISLLDQDPVARMSLLEVSLEESRPMQLQRMMESIGCEIAGYKRTEFGPLKLKGLRKGQWRELTATEVLKLKASCKAAPLSSKPSPSLGRSKDLARSSTERRRGPISSSFKNRYVGNGDKDRDGPFRPPSVRRSSSSTSGTGYRSFRSTDGQRRDETQPRPKPHRREKSASEGPDNDVSDSML